MTALSILVDYDNLPQKLQSTGAVSVAKSILAVLPSNLLHPYGQVDFRLYGGWRTSAGFTTAVQAGLLPEIRANTKSAWQFTHIGTQQTLFFTLSLAVGLVGTRRAFPGTLAPSRDLRRFKARKEEPWRGCREPQSCGFALLRGADYKTPCTAAGCGVQLNEVLVRDEQKMVDTMMVADIAHKVFVEKATEVVLLSSDVDMWPGIFLALNAGVRVTHVHGQAGWLTPPDLKNTLDHPLLQNYRELALN